MECPTDNDVRATNAGPVGFGSVRDMQSSPLNAEMMNSLKEAAERTDRLLGEERLSTAAATAEAPSIEQPTRKDQTFARTIGKRAIKFLDLGREAQDRVWTAYDDAMKLANGTTKMDSTWWMNLQNATNKFFVNERADMLSFLDRFAHVVGRLGFQNPFAQAFNQMIPKIRGMNQIFIQRHETLARELTPYMRRTGRSTTDIAEIGGHYLNCLHAPERNAHLLSRWKEQVAANEKTINQIQSSPIDQIPEDALLTLRDLKRQNTTLTKQIENLEANLDNANPPQNLVTGGYTNGQAKAKMEYIEKTYGLSKQELEGIARRISDEFNYITEELSKAGIIPPEQLAAIPDFRWYAPQLSRRMNLEAVSNDATHYTPGARHAMEGMTGEPDSAFSSLGFAARRASTEIGMQDFGLMLAALERKFARTKDGNPDWTSPILSFNDSQLSGTIQHGSPKQQAIGLAIRANNGMVVNVPVTAADGTRSFERRYFWFNPEFVDGKITGEGLNIALSSNYKLGSKLTEALATATSYYGQSFTRFSPGFAPVAGIRDLGERAMHLANRDYYTAEGEHIAGSSLVGKFTTNIPRAGQMLMQAMRGKADANSDAARYFDEYRRWGLQQKFTPGVRQEPKDLNKLAKGNRLADELRSWGLNKQADWLQGKNLGPMRRVINESGAAGREALRVLDGWNDWNQNIPSFAHYVTLREAGLAPREAAYGVREIMDMSQSGQIARHLGVIAPFVRPTMQGAAAFARTMGLSGRNAKEIFESGKKGWMTGLAASIAFSVLYPLARESMGVDETGRPRMDSLPVSRLTNFFPIGIGDDGSYIKLPMGFGPVRVASALSLSMDRVARGLMDPSDAAFEVLFAVARDTVPGNNPQFDFGKKPAEFIAQYICPAPLKPFMELATNTNAFGGKIQNIINQDKAAADQGFKTTPAVWHRIARDVLQATGQDFTPEAYRHIAKGLAFGPLRMITSGIVNFAEEGELHRGMHKPTAMEEMGPALATLGGTLWYGKVRDTSQHYYYEAADELMAKAKRAGVDMKQDGKKGAEGDDVVQRKLQDAGLDPADVEDIIRLRQARKLLIGYGADFNKAHPRWYEEEDATSIKEDFEKVAIQSEAVYKDFVQNANYFSRR